MITHYRLVCLELTPRLPAFRPLLHDAHVMYEALVLERLPPRAWHWQLPLVVVESRLPAEVLDQRLADVTNRCTALLQREIRGNGVAYITKLYDAVDACTVKIQAGTLLRRAERHAEAELNRFRDETHPAHDLKSTPPPVAHQPVYSQLVGDGDVFRLVCNHAAKSELNNMLWGRASALDFVRFSSLSIGPSQKPPDCYYA